MGFFDRKTNFNKENNSVKQRVRNKINQIKLKNEVGDLYHLAIKEINGLEQYLEEIQAVAPHRHFAVVEAEEKIMSLIEENSKILQVQSKKGRTIGMRSARYNLTKVMEATIDDPIASLIQDNQGYNVGKWALEYFRYDIVSKALDNHEMSIQQTNVLGSNLGMACAILELEDLTIKAMDNTEALLQQNYEGENMAMIAASFKMEKAAIKGLDNNEVSLQQNIRGLNLGMICAKERLANATMKALDNPVASTQLDNEQYNIAAYCVINGLDDCAIKALENKESCFQILNNGKNFPILALRFNRLGVVQEAIKDKDIRNFEGGAGTIRNYAEMYKYQNIVEEIDRLNELSETKEGYINE